MTERTAIIPSEAPEAEGQEQSGGEVRIAPARPRDKVIDAVTALRRSGKLKTWHSDSRGSQACGEMA